MKLHVEWGRPIPLRDASRDNMIYGLALDKVLDEAGVYIFGRRWGSQFFEALYVGQGTNLRSRVKGQLNDLRLMLYLRSARNGKRVLLPGRLVAKGGQKRQKCLNLLERAFIRHFLSEGHDLVNKQGTRLRRHEVASSGKYPKRFFPREIYLAKAKGE